MQDSSVGMYAFFFLALQCFVSVTFYTLLSFSLAVISGGVVEWESCVVLRHIASGYYLAVKAEKVTTTSPAVVERH